MHRSRLTDLDQFSEEEGGGQWMKGKELGGQRGKKWDSQHGEFSICGTKSLSVTGNNNVTAK